MVMIRKTLVVGAFEAQAAAGRAVQALREFGVPDKNLGLVARDRVENAPAPANVEAQHRGGSAAVGGAAAGAAAGALAVLGLSLIPGLGFIAAGGLLLSALGGAAFGAAAGTFVAPFIALELSEEDARKHAGEVEAGRTVVVVREDKRQEEIRDLLRKHGAYDDRVNPTT